MPHDLLTQLREYGHQLDAQATPLTRAVPTPTPPLRPRAQPWAIVVVAAIITFLLGGLVALLGLGSGTIQPADTPDTTVPPAPPPALGAGWVKTGLEEGGPLAASSDLGFVVTGYTEPGPDSSGPIAWHSSDGTTWTRATGFESDPDVSLIDVAAGGPGFVAVGNKLAGSYHAMIWTSSDGQHWQAVTDTLPSGGCAGLQSVEATSDAVVAFGCTSSGTPAAIYSTDGDSWKIETLPNGTGFLAAASGESGFFVLPAPNVVVYSSTGSSWETKTVETPPDNESGEPAVGVDGLLLRAGALDGLPMIWTSTDHGKTWTRTSMILEEGFPVGEILGFHDLISTPFGYVGVGMLGEMDEAFEEDPLNAVGFLVHSWDGTHWRAMSLDDAPPFTELVATDSEIVGTFAGMGSWIWSPPTPVASP